MIIAFASKKGGVGKTTTAVSLAAALGRKGRRVLLADLDPQASASLSLGIPRAELAPSSADVLFDNLPLDQAIRTTDCDRVDLLTSSTDLVGLEERLATFRAREQVLRAKLTPWNEVYDFILIDCPAGFSLLTRCALVASQGYILPVMPHFLAQEGIANLIPAIDRLSAKNEAVRSGPASRLLGILLTMVDYRTRDARRVVEEIRAAHGRDVLAVEVRINVRLAEAPSEGKSIFEYDPSCAGAVAYDLVADEILLRTASPIAIVDPARSRPSEPEVGSNGSASRDLGQAAVPREGDNGRRPEVPTRHQPEPGHEHFGPRAWVGSH